MIEVKNYSTCLDQEILTFLQSCFKELGYEFNLDYKDKDLSDIGLNYLVQGGCFFAAINDGEIVGTIGLRPMNGRVLELKRFYVKGSLRRKGIGNILLENALRFSIENGIDILRLDTTKRSQEAISLFVKQGFREIKQYNNDPYAEVFMELRL